jgi:creatinine amidohydrolase/Fe(II)-dependent formamide hydrolase-like protein
MLHLRPELVRLNSFPPHRHDEIPTEEMSRRMFIQRPNNSVGVNGISDDSRHATKEKGAEILPVIVKEVAKAFRQFMGK